MPAVVAPELDDAVLTPELIELGRKRAGQWSPTRDIPYLPQRAPVRSLAPGAMPPPATVRERLRHVGVDPESAGAIISRILHEGWSFWLSGGDQGAGPRFCGNILEPRYGAVWAWYAGATPAEALGGAFVLCLDEPPWGPDESGS
jgi:hypothetical protein